CRVDRARPGAAGAAGSWASPASPAASPVYEDGSIADRVLLDGTIEHHDPDGTFTHVTLDDGATVLIDGDMDHPYVAHRNLAEFSYETHQLTGEQSRERFAQLSPARSEERSEGRGWGQRR